MIAALVQGTLFRAPESRVSKAGKPFTITTLKEGKVDDIRWINVVAFSESIQAELMRLGDGDAIAVQGQRQLAKRAAMLSAELERQEAFWARDERVGPIHWKDEPDKFDPNLYAVAANLVLWPS
jgi:hypothetical protein